MVNDSFSDFIFRTLSSTQVKKFRQTEVIVYSQEKGCAVLTQMKLFYKT